MAHMNSPAQPHVNGALITTTSYISVHLRKCQSNFGIFLRIWSSELLFLYSYTFLHYILRTCFADLQLTRQETRLGEMCVCGCLQGRGRKGRQLLVLVYINFTGKGNKYVLIGQLCYNTEVLSHPPTESWKVSPLSSFMFLRTTSKSN